jgi:hypothetical protein
MISVPGTSRLYKKRDEHNVRPKRDTQGKLVLIEL